ncbi:MAG: hypothetical protein Q8Q81_08795 [Oxalobacteraceae bacterium]|nr:hypothetical protein [Oxalobacteraceae bacterium]
MNRLLLVVLLASIGLAACSKKEVVVAPGAPLVATAPLPAAATAPNTGKVLQTQQAGGYTYAEVDTGGGQKVWIAGGPIQVKPGDSVQWGEYAAMQNFTSKSLGRTFDEILFVNSWGPVGGATAEVAPHGSMPANHAAQAPAAPSGQQPGAGSAASQGEVKSVTAAGGYSYLEVDQGGTVVWLAAPETAVKAGDKVRWDGGMIMQNFTAKSLGRTFDNIIFADKVDRAQ